MLFIKQSSLAVFAAMALSLSGQAAGGESAVIYVVTNRAPSAHTSSRLPASHPPRAAPQPKVMTCVACPDGNCAGQSLATACRSGVCLEGRCLNFSGKRGADEESAEPSLELDGRESLEQKRRANSWCLLWDTSDPEGVNVRACVGCNGQNKVCS